MPMENRWEVERRSAMTKFLLFFLVFVLQPVSASNLSLMLGDEMVIIKQQYNGEGKTFVHLHQNETTALQAAKKVISEQGGSLLTLIHSGKRNIVFHLHQKRYEFDPNRIFTATGIKKTLLNFGPYSLEAHKEVQKLALAIKKRLPTGKIIAVHNNQFYSLKDYLPGHALALEAKQLNYSDKSHPRNFYLMTQNHDFLRLTKLKFNGVLQAPLPSDDGSLSIYLSHQDYINVEAGYDQLTAQIKMLRYA